MLRPILCCLVAIAIAAPSVPAQEIEIRLGGDIRTAAGDETTFEPKPVPEHLRDEFDRQIARLDDPSWNVRREAAAWFRSVEVDDDVIRTLLETRDLTREQRHQLVNVMRHRILNAPAGALGIQMTPAPQFASGVVITSLVTGMPAEEVLKVDDRVSHVNGERILGTEGFQEAVAGYEPGDTIALTIHRPKGKGGGRVDPENVEVMEVEITLGSAEDLGEGHMQRLRRSRLQQAERLVLEYAPQPVELRLPPGEPVGSLHPAVAELKKQLEFIQSGRLRDTPRLRAEWRRTREYLRQQMLEPDIDPEERRRRIEIYRQYSQLLPEGI